MSREAVLERSGGRCEALIALPRTWTRCGKNVVDIHHALKRSRGGHLLDPHTDVHLIALCRAHHHYAETSGDDSGLLIDGYVTTEGDRPIYIGSDPVLTKEFGREAWRDREGRAG